MMPHWLLRSITAMREALQETVITVASLLDNGTVWSLHYCIL